MGSADSSYLSHLYYGLALWMATF